MLRTWPGDLLRTGGLGFGLAGAVVLPLGMGTTFIVGDPLRYASPTFNVAKDLTRGLPWLAPLEWWGLLMLLGAFSLMAGIVIGDLGTLRLCLVIGAGFWAFWGVQYLAAGVRSQQGDLLAPWIYLAVAMMYTALAQGVAKVPGR